MLYVAEVIDCMEAQPRRDFKMIELVAFISAGREMTVREKRAVQRSVQRALHALSETGSVLIRPPRAARGGYCQYRWKTDPMSHSAPNNAPA